MASGGTIEDTGSGRSMMLTCLCCDRVLTAATTGDMCLTCLKVVWSGRY